MIKTLRVSVNGQGLTAFTPQVVQAVRESGLDEGLCTLFIQHTSASLTINENADATVRGDFERHFNEMVPENAPYYEHTYEGPDDMPAHLKSSILGASVTVPLTQGRLNMGTWQGIYLCEHRDRASSRKLVLTVQGV